MPDVSEQLLPTRARVVARVADNGAARAREAATFGDHALGLALLGLGELRRDDDQAEVDHEKSANLLGYTVGIQNKSFFL